MKRKVSTKKHEIRGVLWFIYTICMIGMASWGIGVNESAAQVGIFANQDSIGDDNGAGAARYEDGIYTIEASGSGVFPSRSYDGFYYVWNEVEGNFRITAEVEWGPMIQPPGRSSDGEVEKRAGIMLRADDPVNPGSRYQSLQIQKIHWMWIQERLTLGQNAVDNQVANTNSANAYGLGYTNVLRMVRTDERIITYRQRLDGTFQPYYSRLTRSVSGSQPKVAVGLYATASNTNHIASVNFRNVTLERFETGARLERVIRTQGENFPGETITVRLNAVIDSGQSADVVVKEIVPEDFTILEVNEGGEVNGNVITWSLENASDRTTLTYEVMIDESHPGGEAVFNGTIETSEIAFDAWGRVNIIVPPQSSGNLGLFSHSEDILHSQNLLGQDGKASYDPKTNSYQVFGSGVGFVPTRETDHFHFTYKEIDVEEHLTIRARIDWRISWNMQGDMPVGLMIRNDLTPSSANAVAIIVNQMRYVQQWRSYDGLPTEWAGGTRSVNPGPGENQQRGFVELRWHREDDQVDWYFYSEDTNELVHWVDTNELNTFVDFESPVYVGLAVSSGIPGRYTMGIFTDVEIFVDEEPAEFVSVLDWTIF